MTRKTSAILRLLACAALILTLCLSAALPTMAANLSGPGDEEHPAKAAITKVLKMPVGTDTPKIVFSFTFTKAKLDDDSDSATLATMPALPNQTINFTSASTVESDVASPGVEIVREESGNIVASPSFPWPHAGVYVYTVEEAESVTGADSGIGTVTYSRAEYEISVYVDNGDNGLFVKFVEARRTKADAGTAVADKPKVDPTLGGDQENYFYSQMIFNNEYAKSNGGTDPEETGDTVLSISKTVAGLVANRTKYFRFEVTVTKPAVGVGGTPKYIAYVVDASGVVSPIVPDNIAAGAYVKTDSNGKSYIEFTSGTKQDVNLKHGQRLAFMNLEVGASFIVSEKAEADYKAGYSVVLNNGTPQTKNNSAVNTALAYPDSGTAYLGEAVNKVDYTNTRNKTTPTGISVDNLPYFALIGVAAAALVATFVVIKVRRKGAKQGA